MAFHVTHRIATRTQSEDATPIVVELLRDLPAAPGSVDVLPITAQDALVEWSFGDDLGRGLLTTWFRPKMYEPLPGTAGAGLMALLEGGNPSAFRLRVMAGTMALFNGRPDLQQFDHPIRGVGAETYTVTFNDGLREVASKRRTIGGQVLPFTLLDVAFDYPGEAGVVVAHPWRPTLQTPDGPDLSLFDRVTVPTPPLTDRADTYGKAITEMLAAFLANVGYSPSTGRMIYQYVRLGRDGAHYTGKQADNFGDPFTLPVPTHQVFRVGQYQTERRGAVYVEIVDNDTNAVTLSTTEGTPVPGLDDLTVTWPYIPDGSDADDDQTIRVYRTSPPSLYIEKFEDGADGAVSGDAYPDELVAKVLHDWLGAPRIRIKDATLAGFLDPMLPFRATIRPGVTRVFRAIKGRWDLKTGVTRALEALEVGVPA
ncbi:MAG: hypothetical protein IAE99_07860 [Rhodothermales bacterium]|nr:hypothetical protein [Rhodothermales bacterium]